MDQEEIKLRDLYPELSEEESREAEANLRKYVEFGKKILDDLSEEERHQLAIRLQWEKRFKGKNFVSQNR